MNPGLLALIIVLGVVVLTILIIVIWWISTSNKMRREIIKIDEALSGIDVALTKRYDLLTKSISAVKGYAKHEAENLEKLTKLINSKKNTTKNFPVYILLFLFFLFFLPNNNIMFPCDFLYII